MRAGLVICEQAERRAQDGREAGGTAHSRHLLCSEVRENSMSAIHVQAAVR